MRVCLSVYLPMCCNTSSDPDSIYPVSVLLYNPLPVERLRAVHSELESAARKGRERHNGPCGLQVVRLTTQCAYYALHYPACYCSAAGGATGNEPQSQWLSAHCVTSRPPDEPAQDKQKTGASPGPHQDISPIRRTISYTLSIFFQILQSLLFK